VRGGSRRRSTAWTVISCARVTFPVPFASGERKSRAPRMRHPRNIHAQHALTRYSTLYLSSRFLIRHLAASERTYQSVSRGTYLRSYLLLRATRGPGSAFSVPLSASGSAFA
jgi:hypothetical protein